MKVMLSKKPAVATALLMMLSLYILLNMIVFVNATKPPESPTVYIDGSGSVELIWKSGKSQIYYSNASPKLGGLDTIAIAPNHGWHIYVVLIDGVPQDILDEDGFSLIIVCAKDTISVAFLENGGVDDVDLGFNTEAYPDPHVGLIFDNVLADGFVYACTAEFQPPNAEGDSWDVMTDAIFDQSVMIILVLNLADLDGSDPTALRLLRTENDLARADVNSDGYIDGTDVSIVANANPSEIGDPNYDPRLDQNSDGVIHDDDVNIVNDFVGESVWEDITLQVIVDNDLVYVYGLTDRFSIFGVTRRE